MDGSLIQKKLLSCNLKNQFHGMLVIETKDLNNLRKSSLQRDRSGGKNKNVNESYISNTISSIGKELIDKQRINLIDKDFTKKSQPIKENIQTKRRLSLLLKKQNIDIDQLNILNKNKSVTYTETSNAIINEKVDDKRKTKTDKDIIIDNHIIKTTPNETFVKPYQFNKKISSYNLKNKILAMNSNGTHNEENNVTDYNLNVNSTNVTNLNIQNNKNDNTHKSILKRIIKCDDDKPIKVVRQVSIVQNESELNNENKNCSLKTKQRVNSNQVTHNNSSALNCSVDKFVDGMIPNVINESLVIRKKLMKLDDTQPIKKLKKKYHYKETDKEHEFYHNSDDLGDILDNFRIDDKLVEVDDLSVSKIKNSFEEGKSNYNNY